MGLRSADIGTSKIAPKQRHIQLYKDLHNMFLRTDFVNLQDFNVFVQEMNARFTELETKITKELTTLQAGLASHTHIAPQAPAGAIPTAPPTTPPYTSAFAATKPVTGKLANVNSRDSALQALGPAVAPLGSSIV